MGKRKTFEETKQELLELEEQQARELEELEEREEEWRREMEREFEREIRKSLEREWEFAKVDCRELRETLKKSPGDSDAYWYDQYARNRYGDLYTAEFAGEKDPAPSYSWRSPPPLPTSDHTARIAEALAPRKEVPPQGGGARYDYYRPIRSGGLDQVQEQWYNSPFNNFVFLAGVVILLVYFRRSIRSILWMSAQVLYVVPLLVAVLLWEITRLPIHFFAGFFAWAARTLWDYVLLPPLRWLGRELAFPVVVGVFDALVASWVLYGSTWVLWRMFGYFETSGAALFAVKWAARACVVAVPWAGGERSRVAVTMYYCWAVYAVLCLVWWYWPASPTTTANPSPLSLVEMVEGDTERVVVRTVREALGVDDRLFTFSMGRWERRIMDWFVATGYTLRPCVFSDCMVPAEDRW
ncbi:hypothetical protein PG993_002929 [Apiospora rasikravindrae]|uniref:Uncharacterized protein n=1 Tax=Apiospora rasikravindrae TaxID=990691 RepID=A0ABR1U0R1_9PEZI